jgi:hypothetical protein
MDTQYKVTSAIAHEKFFKFTDKRGGKVIPIDVTNIVISSSVSIITKNKCARRTSLVSVIMESPGCEKIMDEAFKECRALEQMSFSLSLAEIGNGVFYKCSSLCSVSFPPNLRTIGKEAFFQCSKLREVMFSSDSVLDTIGARAFFGCDISSIAFPSNLRSIGNGAFSSNEMRSLELPNNIQHIGELAFNGCERIDGMVAIPSTITIIQRMTFRLCTNMTGIHLPSALTEICDRAFDTCYALESIVIPETVTKIGSAAFECCRSLQQVRLPCSVREIKKETFNGCRSLTVIQLLEGLEDIGEFAFAYCVAIEEIIIPSTVQLIHKYAFVGCTSLQRLVFNDDLEQLITNSGCRIWWNSGIERISLLTGVLLSRHNVAKRCCRIQKHEWVTVVRELIRCIAENVSMNASVMSHGQQGDDCQEEHLIGYLENVILQKLNYYEGLKEAGFLLELLLWRSCILVQECTVSDTDDVRSMARLRALSMLPIIFNGVIEYL